MSRRRSGTRERVEPKTAIGLFVSRAESLRRTPFVQSFPGTHLTISWRRHEPLRMSGREPEDDVLRSFLTHLRPFLSPEETIHLNHIHNLCFTHTDSDQLRGYLKGARQDWIRCLKGDGLRFEHNGRRMIPEFITDLWINKFYFHADAAMQALLDSISPPALLLNRTVFLNHICNATSQVLYLASIATIGIRDGLFRY